MASIRRLLSCCLQPNAMMLFRTRADRCRQGILCMTPTGELATESPGMVGTVTRKPWGGRDSNREHKGCECVSRANRGREDGA